MGFSSHGRGVVTYRPPEDPKGPVRKVRTLDAGVHLGTECLTRGSGSDGELEDLPFRSLGPDGGRGGGPEGEGPLPFTV